MSAGTTGYDAMNAGLFAVCGKRKSGALVPILVGCQSRDSARDALVTQFAGRRFDCPLVVAKKVSGRYVEARETGEENQSGVSGGESETETGAETLGPEDLAAIRAEEKQHAESRPSRSPAASGGGRKR